MFSLNASCVSAEALAGEPPSSCWKSLCPAVLPDEQLASNTMQTVPRIRNVEARFAFIVFSSLNSPFIIKIILQTA